MGEQHTRKVELLGAIYRLQSLLSSGTEQALKKMAEDYGYTLDGVFEG